MSFLEPEPLLFNFLIPGREEQPFYGACLVMYRPATEAMLDGDEEVRTHLLTYLTAVWYLGS